jgi:hypothetical protein
MKIWEPKPPGTLWATPACFYKIRHEILFKFTARHVTKKMGAREF